MTTLLLALAAGALILVVLLTRVRAARRARRAPRRVEAPNSQYRSPYVMDLEARERWEAIARGGLHEVNRAEVERLLVKVRASGVRSLAPPERALLDRMADAQERGAPRKQGEGSGIPPGLRVRESPP